MLIKTFELQRGRGVAGIPTAGTHKSADMTTSLVIDAQEGGSVPVREFMPTSIKLTCKREHQRQYIS